MAKIPQARLLAGFHMDFNNCGETGIRTRDRLLTYTRYPGVPLQPLEHLSLADLFCKYTALFLIIGTNFVKIFTAQ